MAEEGVHTSGLNEVALLSWVILNYDQWFTPEDVYEKVRKSTTLTVEEIKEFLCKAASNAFFYSSCIGENWKFKRNCQFIS